MKAKIQRLIIAIIQIVCGYLVLLRNYSEVDDLTFGRA